MLKGSWICVGAEYQKMSGRKISCNPREHGHSRPSMHQHNRAATT